MIWLTYGTLAAISIVVIYIALPWGAKLIIRKRFLAAAGSGDVVFLTFDDGPSPEGTPRILEILRKADAKATFFVLGKNVERYPGIAGSISANGHEVGEHGYAHCHAWRSGPFKTLRDLVKGSKVIRALIPDSQLNTAYRPPFGKFNLVSLLYIWLGNKRVAFWDVDPQDYSAASARKVAHHVIRKLRAGSVILLHDGRYKDKGDVGITVAALEMILDACRDKGLRAVALKDGMPAPEKFLKAIKETASHNQVNPKNIGFDMLKKDDEQPKCHRQARVLILSKDFSAQGGIVNFVASLIKNSSPSFEYDHLSIGRNSRGRIRNLMFPLIDSIRLARRVAMDNYSCVHINPSMNAKAVLRDGLSLVILGMLGFRRIVVCMHGWEDAFAQRICNSKLWAMLFRKAFSNASTILVLASRFRDTLLGAGFKPDQVRVISTMFDGSMFDGMQRQEEDTRSLLFLSRFIPEKGIYELLEAFAALAQRFPGLSLVMAGDGPERERMVRWVQAHGLTESVLFPGYLRGSAKARALMSAELFIFPTYHGEGCPVSLLEAMAAGLPIVTTRAGGIPDVFTDGKNGIMLNKVSPEAIEHAIETLLNDRQLSSSIRSNNLSRAWQNFEAGAVTQKIENIYRIVANGN